MSERQVSPDSAPITRLLAEWSSGSDSALRELLPLVYERMRQMARSLMRRKARSQTTPPTALVGELYVRLASTLPRHIIEKIFPPPAINLWVGLRNTSNTLFYAGLCAEADGYGRRAISVIEAPAYPPQDPRRAESWWALGLGLACEGKKAEALQTFRHAEQLYAALGVRGAAQVADIHTRIAALERGR